MRICLVSREYPPFFGGGIGTYTVQLSRALAAAGHHVVVVTVGDDGQQKREHDGDITVVRLPFIRAQDWSGPHPTIDTPEHRAAFETFAAVSLFAMQVASALPRLHEEVGFDVVEFPDTGALGWFALNARRTGGLWADGGPAIVSCIHSPTDWIAHYNRRALRERADYELVAMEQDSMGWSDGLVCPSHAVARWVEGSCHLRTGAVDVIHYCLGDLEAVAAARMQEDATSAGVATSPGPGRRILFAGRLEPRKGVDTLLAGFALAVERGADLYLDLVGHDTPAVEGRGQFGRDTLRNLVPEQHHARIIFHGKLPPEQVAQMQSSAHAVAIPAPMDNFPFTCMEAMAHGRVVIASRAGGMEQMVNKGTSALRAEPHSHEDDQPGVLFEPSNIESCAAALQQIAAMSPAELSSLGRRAAHRILDICGNDFVLHQRIKHYQSAIKTRNATVAARRARARRGIVMVNACVLPQEQASRLASAVSLPPPHGCDFVYGWLRLPAGDVVVRSTPRLPTLETRIRNLGPMALAAEAAEHERIASLLAKTERPEHRTTTDTHALLTALCEAGFQGGVIPEVITPLDAPHTLRRRYPIPIQTIRSLVRRMWKLTGGQAGQTVAAEYHAGMRVRTDSAPAASNGKAAQPQPRMID